MKSLKELGAEWRETLKEVEYIGEIGLTVSETERLLSDLKQSEAYGDLQPVLYAVLAVNCAWHFYDDSGFWPHFCSLTRLDSSGEGQQLPGKIIEAGMRLHSKDYRPRPGPFRYVGPVLAHSGISVKYIDKFAAVLRELICFSGLKKLAAIDSASLQARLPSHLPKYMSKFLHDEAGCAFINDVAATLWQLQEGFIDKSMLSELSGFRPEFWPRFFAAFYGQNSAEFTHEERKSREEPSGQKPDSARRSYAPPEFFAEILPARAPYADLSSCYIAPFGKLRIKKAEGIFAGRFMILGEINGKLVKVQPVRSGKPDSASINIDRLVRNLPAKIRLWVEPIGRFSARRELAAWECTLVDKYNIIWPRGELLKPESGVEIRLAAPPDYSLEFQGPAVRQEAHLWHVDWQPSPLRPKLKAKGITIPLALRVRWDFVHVLDSAPILTSENFRDKFLKLEGLPGEEAVIVIANDLEKKVCKTGSFFGKDGKISLNVSAFCGEDLRSWSHPWAVLSQGSETSMGGTIYLDLPLLYKNLPEIGRWSEQFFAALPENAQEMRKLAHAISGGGEFDAGGIENFPLALQAAAWHGAACSAIIDGKKIASLQMALDKLDEQTRYALEWFRWSGYTMSNGLSLDLAPEPPDSQCLQAPAWINELEKLKSQFAFQHGLQVNPGPYIAEWAARLLGSRNLAYDTVIGQLKNGDILTAAWQRPFGNRSGCWHDRARDEGRGLEKEPGLVGSLAKLLLALLLKLKKRNDQLSIFDLDSLPQCLLPIAVKIKEADVSADDVLDMLKNLGASREEDNA